VHAHNKSRLFLEGGRSGVLSSPPFSFSRGGDIMALCTECDAEITLEPSTEVGEIIQCPDCGQDLEVISVEPPELAPAPEEEEDWGE